MAGGAHNAPLPPRSPAGGCARRSSPLPPPPQRGPLPGARQAPAGIGRRMRAPLLPPPSPLHLPVNSTRLFRLQAARRWPHRPLPPVCPRQLQYPWPSAPSGCCGAPARAPLPAPARRGRPDARGRGWIGEAPTAMGGRKPAPVRNRYQRSGGSAAHGIAAQGGAALSQRPL